MFTHDPNIDPKEATYLIKEIISVIRKIATPSSQTRCVVSWNYHYQSSSYNKILLPTFDKYIQVTSFGGKSSSSLSIKINHKMGDECCNSSSNNNSCDNNRHCLLPVRDIYFVPQRSRWGSVQPHRSWDNRLEDNMVLHYPPPINSEWIQLTTKVSASIDRYCILGVQYQSVDIGK